MLVSVLGGGCRAVACGAVACGTGGSCIWQRGKCGKVRRCGCGIWRHLMVIGGLSAASPCFGPVM